MATPAPSWDTTRVYGTWNGQGGVKLSGSYKVVIPQRVTNTTDDLIIPAGTFASGSLNVTPGQPSFDLQIPCNDDPDNVAPATPWRAIIEITFTGPIDGEKYSIDTPRGVAVNLRTAVPIATISSTTPILVPAGAPGGLARLDADGDVVDASGVKVGGGLDEVALGVYLTANPQAPANASVTNAKVASGAAIDLAKTADSTAGAGRLALTTARQTKLDALPADAQSAAQVDARADARIDARITGSPAAYDTFLEIANAMAADDSAATALAATVATKAPTASPTFTGTVSGVTKTHVGLSSVDNVRQVPLTSVRYLPIAATAANTWPARAASLPTGYTGRAEWDHSDFGAVTVLPSDIATGDEVKDLAP